MKRFGKIILGNMLMTSAYAFLTVPQEIVNGGVTSFSMILSGSIGGNTAVIADVATILLLILCYVYLGKEYFEGTIVGGICYMVTFTLFHSFNICLIPIRPVAAFVAAVMVGCGYYLCISQRSTGISFDTIALILNKKNPKINVATVMFIINVCVLMLGIVNYGIWSVILGIGFSGIQSFTLNTLLKREKKRVVAVEN